MWGGLGGEMFDVSVIHRLDAPQPINCVLLALALTALHRQAAAPAISARILFTYTSTHLATGGDLGHALVRLAVQRRRRLGLLLLVRVAAVESREEQYTHGGVRHLLLLLPPPPINPARPTTTTTSTSTNRCSASMRAWMRLRRAWMRSA